MADHASRVGCWAQVISFQLCGCCLSGGPCPGWRWSWQPWEELGRMDGADFTAMRSCSSPGQVLRGPGLAVLWWGQASARCYPSAQAGRWELVGMSHCWPPRVDAHHNDGVSVHAATNLPLCSCRGVHVPFYRRANCSPNMLRQRESPQELLGVRKRSGQSYIPFSGSTSLPLCPSYPILP